MFYFTLQFLVNFVNFAKLSISVSQFHEIEKVRNLHMPRLSSFGIAYPIFQFCGSELICCFCHHLSRISGFWSRPRRSSFGKSRDRSQKHHPLPIKEWNQAKSNQHYQPCLWYSPYVDEFFLFSFFFVVKTFIFSYFQENAKKRKR